MEARKLFGSTVSNYIISARTAQGYEEFRASTPQDRLDIITRWHKHEAELQTFKHGHNRAQSDGREADTTSLKEFIQSKQAAFQAKKRQHDERKARREAERNKIQSQDGTPSCPFCRRDKPHAHTPLAVDLVPTISEPLPNNANAEFEHAIHASVAATSRGDPVEDAIIERAIRASVRELQNDSGSTMSDQEALNRAIQASISEAQLHPVEGPPSDEDPGYKVLLEKSIQDSLANYQLRNRTRIVGDGVDTDDEEIQLAIQASKEAPSSTVVDSDDDENVQLAIRKSEEEHQKSNAEEEIVLEYMKRQSLAEEALRLRRLKHQKDQSQKLKDKGKQGETVTESAADEEALKLAIEESLKTAGGGEISGSGEAAGSGVA
jgi:hypothetical protein